MEVTRPSTTLPPGAGLDVTDILGCDEVEVQPLRMVHLALTFPEPVEYGCTPIMKTAAQAAGGR